MAASSSSNHSSAVASFVENPRGYQSEILERAKNSNIIAFLETGAGKTLVSALLVKHVLSQGDSIGGKIAVFIVEKVALVHQQAEYMQEVNHQYKVGTYYGDKGLDEWSSERWLEEFSERRILVLTAQIFLNALNHALIRMTSVAVIVFDEAHHATGEHPFRRIMVDFYHTLPVNERPKVFGMTASPVKVRADTKSINDCAEAIAMLEETLDATIFGVSEESQEELEALVPTAHDFVALYSAVENVLDDENTQKDDELAMKSGMDALVPSLTNSRTNSRANRNKIKNSNQRYSGSRGNKGNGRKPSIMSKGPKDDIRALLMRVQQSLGRYVATFLSNELMGDKDASEYTREEKEILAKIRNGQFISDHVRVLLDTIMDEGKRWEQETEEKGSFRCIVFVQQRLFAFAIAWVINAMLKPINDARFEAAAVVGCHAKSTYLKMSQNQQNDVLNKFRRGKFGILVATNVVEEGLDIPTCSCVIAFDAVLSSKAYIQARGRARSPGSRYIALVPSNSSMHTDCISRAYQGAQFMKETIKVMNSQNGAEWRLKLKADAKKAMEDNTKIVLLSKSTTARVLPVAAFTLLNRYVWGLHDAANRVNPTYKVKSTKEGFIATVTLPKPSPVPEASSTAQTSSQLAKRIAALNAYVALYEVGEVDEYLLPKLRHERKVPGEQRRYRGTKGPKIPQKVRLLEVDHPGPLKRRKIKCGKGGNDDLKVDETIIPMFMYVVKRDSKPPKIAQPHKWRGSENFGILVENEIHADDLKALICPTGSPVLTLEYGRTIQWTKEQREDCREYMHAIEGCVRGRLPQWMSNLGKREKAPSTSTSAGENTPVLDDGTETVTEYTETGTEFDDDGLEKSKSKAVRRHENKLRAERERKDKPPGFFMVPLLPDEGLLWKVDWATLSLLKSFKVEGPAANSTTEDWSFTLSVSEHEANDRVYFIRNPMKNTTISSKPTSGPYDSYGEYYQKRHSIDLTSETEELLEGFSVADILAGDKKAPFPLCRATCFHIPLSPWAVYTASLLPYWQTYLALKRGWREICVDNSLQFLPFSRSVQPNMGDIARIAPDLNYERNEFLGDAILKLVSSMMAYAKAPVGDEGTLTDYRDDEIANDNLCNIAVKYGIQNCIAYTGITPKAKKWGWFWGIPQIIKQQFSEKVLADCVEALIGAHYLENGLPAAVSFMDRMQIVPKACLILEGVNYEYVCGSEQEEKLNKKRLGDTERIKKVEDIIGYTFNSKDIVLEALTHGSYASGKTRSYQRLEFLGDAVLGFVLLSRYFNAYENLTPGELSGIREPLLSNDVFARVVVGCGLHELVWMESDELSRDIKRFEKSLANEKEDEDVCKQQTVPKILGDILESLVGAIVVDQGMSIEGVEEIVMQIMQPVMPKYSDPHIIDAHPVSKLCQKVQTLHGVTPEWVFSEIDVGSEDENDDDSGNDDGNITIHNNRTNISRGMIKLGARRRKHATECKVIVKNIHLGSGIGPTKPVAKHAAAVNALNLIDVNGSQ